MSRDWERNFSSTMRETEENLSRMRNRLDPARYKPIDSSLIDSPPDSADRPSPTNNFPQKRQSSSRKARPVSSVFAGSSPSYELYRHSAPSTGLIALLSEKVERQNKMLEQLSHHVNELESERRKTDVKVQDLEHQVHTLTTRLTDHRGQHEQPSHVIESWQRDIRSRLEELDERMTKQMVQGGESSYHSEGALVSITRDLHDMKRALQSECDALHHEIETLRTRLVKQEMDLTGSSMEGKELARRVDRLDRKLGQVSSDRQQQHTSQHHALPSGSYQAPPQPYQAPPQPYQAPPQPYQTPPQSYCTQNDIKDLKNEMTRLLTTFGKLDSASQASHVSSLSNPSTVSTTTVSSNRSSRHHRSYPSSISSVKGPPVILPWQQPQRPRKESGRSDGDGSATTSLEDLSDSELSLPLDIRHDEEDDEGGKKGIGKTREIESALDDDDDDDDFSLSLSDLDVSQKDDDFGSTLSLDSDQLDLDLM